MNPWISTLLAVILATDLVSTERFVGYVHPNAFYQYVQRLQNGTNPTAPSPVERNKPDINNARHEIRPKNDTTNPGTSRNLSKNKKCVHRRNGSPTRTATVTKTLGCPTPAPTSTPTPVPPDPDPDCVTSTIRTILTIPSTPTPTPSAPDCGCSF